MSKTTRRRWRWNTVRYELVVRENIIHVDSYPTYLKKKRDVFSHIGYTTHKYARAFNTFEHANNFAKSFNPEDCNSLEEVGFK